MAKNIVEIQPLDYPRQTDETLYEIMAYFGQAYSMGKTECVDARYRYAYEIIQLRQNKYLVEQTKNLVEKTIKVAKWTMVVGIGTAIVALGTIGTFWVMSLPKCP